MSQDIISSLFKEIKKNKKYAIPALAAVLVVIVVIIMMVQAREVAFLNFSDSQAVNKLEGSQSQSYAAAQTPVLKADDKMSGSPTAPLKIFVYEDYTSAYSAALADTLDKIRVETGDKIALIFRPYILNNTIPAVTAAAAVDCAKDQEKWREMRALLFARAKNKQAAPADLDSYIKQIGLNEADFKACLTNEEKSGKIEQLVAEAKAYSVQGAPTMFIGQDMILGARPYDNFVDSNGDQIEGLKAVIDKKLSSI